MTSSSMSPLSSSTPSVASLKRDVLGTLESLPKQIEALKDQSFALQNQQIETLQQLSTFQELPDWAKPLSSSEECRRELLLDINRRGTEPLINDFKPYFSSNESALARFSQIILNVEELGRQTREINSNLRTATSRLGKQTEALEGLNRREAAQAKVMDLFGGIEGFSALPETQHRLTGDYLSCGILQEDLSVMNHSSPILRGVTDDGRVFISIRYTDSSGEKKIFILHERYKDDCNWVSTSQSTVIYKSRGNFIAPGEEGDIEVRDAFKDLATFIQNREYHRLPSDEHSLSEETFKIV